MKTVFMKISRTIEKEEIEGRIKQFEKKYKLDFKGFRNKFKNLEDTGENEGAIEDYDDWAYYLRSLKIIKKGGRSPIIESYIKSVPESKFSEIDDIFTKERIRIIRTLNNRDMESVTDLSKQLKRDRSSVVQDLEILEQEGMIKFKKHGRVTIPQSKCAAITLMF